MRDYEDRIQFLGVGSVDSAEHVEDFVSLHGLSAVPTVIDVDGSLRTSIGVPGHPSWVLIDEDGEARYAIGSVFRPRLIEELEALVSG